MTEVKRNYFINVVGSFCLALTVPWIFFKLFKSFFYKKYTTLAGKVVVITGASSGLGEALAHEFYRYGCQIVLCARKLTELERVKADLLKNVSSVPARPPIIQVLDLSDINSIPDHVNKILSITGKIDILINNGGISHRGTVLSTKSDVDIKIMLVNYFGAVALTKAVLPGMIERNEGHVVSISSVQGLFALPERSAYSASKHALRAFSDSLRAEVACYNINVTVINPGYIQTKLSVNALTGSGDVYGKMDKTTESGYKSDKVAKDIITAIINKEKEVILAPFLPKAVNYIRHFFPSLYFYIMARRARTEKM